MHEGRFATRNFDVPFQRAGFEAVEAGDLVGAAGRVAAEAVEKVRAPQVEPGRYDLLLDPGNLSLTIHETCGHPTELDRALGYEADYLVLQVASRGTVVELLRSLLARHDTVGDEPERLRELLGALKDYELVSVPVPVSSHEPEVPSPDPFHLLRHRKLDAAPGLEVEVKGRAFDVHVSHGAHRQKLRFFLSVQQKLLHLLDVAVSQPGNGKQNGAEQQQPRAQTHTTPFHRQTQLYP